MGRFNDLTGQRINHLTVLYRTDDYISPTGKQTIRWHCRCDCGKEIDVLGNVIRRQQSCGCRRTSDYVDLIGQRFGRLTVVERVEIERQRNGNRHGWKCVCDCGNAVVKTKKDLDSGKVLSCGCLLQETARDKVDVNEKNVLGRADGTMLSKIRPGMPPTKASKSGIRGVYFNGKEGKWIAKISLRRKTIMLGRFDTIEEAAKARREGEEKYFAPFFDEKTKNNK